MAPYGSVGKKLISVVSTVKECLTKVQRSDVSEYTVLCPSFLGMNILSSGLLGDGDPVVLSEYSESFVKTEIAYVPGPR